MSLQVIIAFLLLHSFIDNFLHVLNYILWCLSSLHYYYTECYVQIGYSLVSPQGTCDGRLGKAGQGITNTDSFQAVSCKLWDQNNHTI